MQRSSLTYLFRLLYSVMEAALRTAADVVGGCSLENIKYESLRGLLGIKEATISLGGNDTNGVSNLNVAVCQQTSNVREFLSRMENENAKPYHFIEVMACPGGCIGGGGLPQSRDPDILSKRIDGLYSIDERKVLRKSHENEDVKHLYKQTLVKPLSLKSHKVRYFCVTCFPSCVVFLTVSVPKASPHGLCRSATKGTLLSNLS